MPSPQSGPLCCAGSRRQIPTTDEIERVREAKNRWEAISRELAALSERMTRV